MKTAAFIKSLLLLISVFLLPFVANAQKEGNNWYFGHHAGITFNTNPPTVLFDSQASGKHGHATISDQNGNLLFYFSGGDFSGWSTNKQVFGRNHLPMPNGSGFYGSNIPTAVVPWPGTQKYFMFTYAPHNGVFQNCYSVIDMNLNGGFGDVTAVKNMPFTTSAGSYWRTPVAIKHRNNRDFWLIYMEFSAANNTTTFSAYNITPAGLNLTPVSSAIGQSFVNGGIKASPDGTTIVASSHVGFDVFNFDAATGNVSLKFNVGLTNSSFIEPFEFSPDGTKLYMANHVLPSPNNQGSFRFAQFDMSAPNGIAVMMSATPIIWHDSLQPYPGRINSMQLAPDGKIYMTYGNFNTPNKYLHVIHRPNLTGSATRFQPDYIDLDPNNTGNHNAGHALPFFIQGFFYRPKIEMEQTCFGDTARFSLANRAYADSVKWNFGDPASGTLNTSTSFTPKHFYATAGSYNVQAIVYFNFSSDTLNQTIYIPTSITKPNLGRDTTLCAGDTLFLNAYQPGASYEWQDSINTDPAFAVTKPGFYWVQVSNGCGTLSDTIQVRFDKPLLTNFTPDTLLCAGETLLLTTNQPAGQILWQDGSTQPTYMVTKPGIYYVQANNQCGFGADTIRVSYRPEIVKNWLPKDTVICTAAPFVINGTNQAAVKYLWQDSSVSSTFTAQTSGLYWLEITTPCGTLRDSVQVTFNQLPATRFADTTICSEKDFTLTAPNGLSYRWNTGATSQSIGVSKAGFYKVEIETAPGCFFTDSVTIKTEQCVIIPNIVTPNNDNLNDKFEFKGLETGDYELAIYNRWGTLIYQQKNYKDQWPDKKLSDATYYYLLRNKQTGKTYKGWVEVVK